MITMGFPASDREREIVKALTGEHMKEYLKYRGTGVLLQVKGAPTTQRMLVPESVGLFLKAHANKEHVYEGLRGFIIYFEKGQTDVEELLAYAGRRTMEAGVTREEILEFVEIFCKAGIFTPPGQKPNDFPMWLIFNLPT